MSGDDNSNPEGEVTTGHSGLMNNETLDAITFVDIDFEAFPKLPEYIVPELNVIYIAKNGSNTTGEGSLLLPYMSICEGAF